MTEGGRMNIDDRLGLYSKIVTAIQESRRKKNEIRLQKIDELKQLWSEEQGSAEISAATRDYFTKRSQELGVKLEGLN